MRYAEEEKIGGAHPDYRMNLEKSEKFMKNVAKSLLRGMSVSIGGAGGEGGSIPRCILHIAWTPSKEQRCENRFCTPIFMHQPRREFDQEVETVFNQYMSMVKHFDDKIPKMIQKDLLEGKV